MSSNWNVLLPDKIHEAGPNSIEDFADFTSVSEYGKTEADLIPHIDKFDAIILRTAKISERVIEAANNLKVVSKHGAGLDNVDIPTASKQGIVVCNTPATNSRAVAEHAITLMMATRRNLLQADRNVRNGKWTETRSDWDRFRRSEINSDVLGLCGFGNIAREVADMATCLGMECITYDPYITDEELDPTITRVDKKEELFERSDFVSVHTPLTEETRDSIALSEFRSLGSGGIIINTARGGVIDEEDLLTALQEDIILGAGLDVLKNEPPNDDHPLFKSDKAILTPHYGGISLEATYKMSVRAAENVRTVHEGGIPESTVNRESLTEQRQ